MAADFISIDRSKAHGNQTVRLAQLIQEAQDLCGNLKDNADHQWDVGDHVDLEAKFGLETGSGANFLTLLALVKTALDDSSLVEFVSRVANQ